MAGWVATADEWDAFSDEWYRCLHRPPEINYFNRHEASSCDGEFRQFSTRKRDEKVNSLVDVICKSKLRYGLFASVRHRLFDKKPAKVHKMVGTRAYDWGVYTAVSSVLQHQLSLGETFDRVDFVFDYRSELQSCINVYEEMKTHFPAGQRAIAGLITPGDDKEIMGLQAADLFAGQICAIAKGAPADLPFKTLAKCKTLLHCPFIPPVDLATNLGYLSVAYPLWGEAIEFLKLMKKYKRAKR